MFGVYEEIVKEDLHIPAVRVFEVTKNEEGVRVDVLEDSALGRNVWLEDRYIDTLLELEEYGILELKYVGDLYEVYEVHGYVDPIELTVWSYKFIRR